MAIVAVSLTLASFVFADPQAVFGSIKGKVEVKSAQGDWSPAAEGMKIDLRTTVSTGFDSTAVLLIEKSKLVVKPLTRLTLDKLLERSSGSVAASLFLRVGSVQASVKAATPGVPQDFKVQSPYSTASVRGTEFEFDGFHLTVMEGVVRLVPGRPTRDTQAIEGAEQGNAGEKPQNTGFEGALPVDPANSNAGVNVAQNQQAFVDIHQSLGAGASLSPGQTTGSSGAPGRPATPKSGGVTITVKS
jgi:hypothetical protein